MSGIRVLSRSGSRAEIGSEKLDNTEQRSISSPSRRNWKSACVTFFASIISFVLGLVVLLSGATNGQLRDNSMVQVSYPLSLVGGFADEGIQVQYVNAWARSYQVLSSELYEFS